MIEMFEFWIDVLAFCLSGFLVLFVLILTLEGIGLACQFLARL